MAALETQYGGYIFRSRTEARWAVAFNEAGIEYEYEKQGYDLRGEPYLPDFWLPEPRWWIEIKAGAPSKRECKLARLLMLESGCNTFVFCGPPATVQHGGFAVWSFPALGKPQANRRGQRVLHDLAQFLAALRLGCCFGPEDEKETQRERLLTWKLMGDFEHGLGCGRKARFEHGQRGAPRQWAKSWASNAA